MALPVNMTDACQDWRQYTSADFGEDFSLADANGVYPRCIVMIEAGDLLCKNPAGVNRSLLGLPAFFPHWGKVSVILAAQTAGFVAYW